jgi:hypothetical protein
MRVHQEEVTVVGKPGEQRGRIDHQLVGEADPAQTPHSAELLDERGRLHCLPAVVARLVVVVVVWIPEAVRLRVQLLHGTRLRHTLAERT